MNNAVKLMYLNKIDIDIFIDLTEDITGKEVYIISVKVISMEKRDFATV